MTSPAYKMRADFDVKPDLIKMMKYQLCFCVLLALVAISSTHGEDDEGSNEGGFSVPALPSLPSFEDNCNIVDQAKNVIEEVVTGGKDKAKEWLEKGKKLLKTLPFTKTACSKVIEVCEAWNNDDEAAQKQMEDKCFKEVEEHNGWQKLFNLKGKINDIVSQISAAAECSSA